MALDPLTSLASIKTELEAGWTLFDNIYNTFGPREWSRKFGKTWTYADQPYHLAYFDAMIARFVGFGPDVPKQEWFHLRSIGDMNEWNQREFARREPGHTVEQSLAAMRASREDVRRVVNGMTDADLERRTWMPLIFGWGPARGVLHGLIMHNVAEYWKLWLRTGKRGPLPSPAAIHVRLAFMMNFMPMSMNRELAATTPLTVVWHFDGPGGGWWTLRVRDGVCRVSETADPNPDLTITMRPEVFHKLVAKMTPAPLLILTRQMRITGFSKMEPSADSFLSRSRIG